MAVALSAVKRAMQGRIRLSGHVTLRTMMGGRAERASFMCKLLKRCVIT